MKRESLRRGHDGRGIGGGEKTGWIEEDRVGKRERRSGVHVHSAYLMQSECIGPRISWRRRRRDAIFLGTKERLNVSFIIRTQISRIVVEIIENIVHLTSWRDGSKKIFLTTIRYQVHSLYFVRFLCNS